MKYFLYDTRRQNIVGTSNYGGDYHLDRWDMNYREIDKLISAITRSTFQHNYKIIFSLKEIRYYINQSKKYNIRCWAGINPNNILVFPYYGKKN